MKNLTSLLVRFEEVVTKLLLTSIVILVFYSAMVRWMGVPVAWSVEMGQLLFIWLIFLGANQALRKDRHIGVDILTKKLPAKMKVGVSLLTDGIIACFLVIIVFYGVEHVIDHSLRSVQNLPISYSYITASVPVGCSLMILTLLIKWLSSLKGKRNQSIVNEDKEKNSRGMLS